MSCLFSKLSLPIETCLLLHHSISVGVLTAFMFIYQQYVDITFSTSHIPLTKFQLIHFHFQKQLGNGSYDM